MPNENCKKEFVSLHLRFQFGLGSIAEVNNFTSICLCSVCRSGADILIKLNNQDLVELRSLAFFDSDTSRVIKTLKSPIARN